MGKGEVRLRSEGPSVATLEVHNQHPTTKENPCGNDSTSVSTCTAVAR